MIKELFSIFKESTNSFAGQEKEEKVVLLLRKHPFVIIIRMFLFVAVSTVPVAVGLAFANEIVSKGWLTIYLFISSVWYLCFWISAFYSLTMYTLNTVIITSRRIISNEQIGYFNRKISELHSHRIQDVTTHTSGLIGTLLRFGSITVQTAASEKQFIFRQMPDPDKVKDAVMQLARSSNSGVKPEL